MSKLLPEFWPDQKAEEGTAKQVNQATDKRRYRIQVYDFSAMPYMLG